MVQSVKKVFDTDRRIRLGIWGLGRGGSFFSCAAALNIDVVAGCDFNDGIREHFAQEHPGVFVTADEDEFLAQDIDAVLVSTWFCAHADHSIKALRAGKHVMCEVTSFFTPAEGVRLVEAVEASGKVYNLLENYPFMKSNMMARKLWQEGLFGEFTYGEFDYNHDCRNLAYSYFSRTPVEPGYTLHNWRSWLNWQYYNTHSLGPVMMITGLRPVKVAAPDTGVQQPGTVGNENHQPAVSMVTMSNGGIFRNLLPVGSCDTHAKRLWGTRAFGDFTDPENCRVVLGACGHGRELALKTEWPELGDLADTMGHGGGDFWELYYFAREVLYGIPAPWNIYSACDATLTGIMAVRSQQQGGIPLEIPDFRDPKVREQYRGDTGSQSHFDPRTVLFPVGHNPKITGNFTKLMHKMFAIQDVIGTALIRSAFDGMKLYGQIADDTGRLAVVNDVRKLLAGLDELADTICGLQQIAAAYPESPAADTIRKVLAVSEPEKILDTEKTRAELLAFLAQPDDQK